MFVGINTHKKEKLFCCGKNNKINTKKVKAVKCEFKQRLPAFIFSQHELRGLKGDMVVFIKRKVGINK